MSWVMNSAVLRVSPQMRSSSRCMNSRVWASRAANGSSSSNISGSVGPLALRRTSQELQAVDHVTQDGSPRQQARLLEHHRPVRAWARNRLAIELERAARDGLQAVDGVQERRLAATRGSDNGDELAGTDVQGDAVDRLKWARRALDPIVDRDVRGTQLGGAAREGQSRIVYGQLCVADGHATPLYRPSRARMV